MTSTRILHFGGTSYCCRDLRAVEIRAKADAVLANMFENVLEVINHQFNGRVHIVPTIPAEEASSEVDADNAAGFTDCSQLTVDEISRMRAQGMRIGVRGDEGRIADSGNVPETAFVKVRKINQNPPGQAEAMSSKMLHSKNVQEAAGSAALRSVLASLPRRGLRKLAGSNTIV